MARPGRLPAFNGLATGLSIRYPTARDVHRDAKQFGGALFDRQQVEQVPTKNHLHQEVDIAVFVVTTGDDDKDGITNSPRARHLFHA